MTDTESYYDKEQRIFRLIEAGFSVDPYKLNRSYYNVLWNMIDTGKIQRVFNKDNREYEWEIQSVKTTCAGLEI